MSLRSRAHPGAAVLALAFAAAVLGTACPRPPPLERPGLPPKPEELLAALVARQSAVRSMNARVRATSWLGGDRVRATVLMLVDRGGRLRLEAEVGLQGTVAVLTTDGERFAFLDQQKNVLRRGAACPENVASLVRIPLASGDVAALLLGDIRLPPGARPAGPVAWDSELGAEVLSIAGGVEPSVSLRRHEGGWDVVAAQAGPPGRRWKALYRGHEWVAGTRMPAEVLFAEDGRSFDDGVEIRFKDRTLNESFPPERFRLEPPPGVSVEEIGCGPAAAGQR